jgi:hypothetical protein
LHSYRFVKKYMYPYFSIVMGITNNCSSSRFYLSRRNPSRSECLEAKSTKTNGITSSSYPPHLPSMLFTKFRSFRVIVHSSSYLYFKIANESFLSFGFWWVKFFIPRN